VNHDVYCGAANPPDRVPALLARFLIDPVFFQDPAFIGKHAGGERKGNAVFLLIQAVLSLVPFQPHVYIVYICWGGDASAKSCFAKTRQKQVEAFEDIREDLGNSGTVTYYPKANPNEGFRKITIDPSKMKGRANL